MASTSSSVSIWRVGVWGQRNVNKTNNAIPKAYGSWSSMNVPPNQALDVTHTMAGCMVDLYLGHHEEPPKSLSTMRKSSVRSMFENWASTHTTPCRMELSGRLCVAYGGDTAPLEWMWARPSARSTAHWREVSCRCIGEDSCSGLHFDENREGCLAGYDVGHGNARYGDASQDARRWLLQTRSVGPQPRRSPDKVLASPNTYV